MRALVYAVRDGDEKAVRALLAHPDVDINAIVPWCQVWHGVEFDDYNDGSVTALMTASAVGDEEIVKLLLATPGIDVNFIDGITALEMAVHWERTPIVVLLADVPGIHLDAALNEALKHWSRKDAAAVLLAASRWAARRPWVLLCCKI